MFYTLGQAAKATGKSKPTLSRAIQSGRMSGQKQEDGSYLIDPAELHRVFPPVAANGNATDDTKQDETPNTVSTLQAQLDVLREERERERGQLQAVIDDLRGRLDEETAERRQTASEIRRLTLLLTDQRQPLPVPQPEAPPPVPEPAPPLPAVPPALWFGLGLAAATAAAWYFWPLWTPKN